MHLYMHIQHMLCVQDDCSTHIALQKEVAELLCAPHTCSVLAAIAEHVIALFGFPAGCWWDCSGNHCGCAQEATSPAHQLPHPQRHPECCCSRGGCAQAVLPHGDTHPPLNSVSIALRTPAASIIAQGWPIVTKLVCKATSPPLVNHPYVVLLRNYFLHLVNGLHQIQ